MKPYQKPYLSVTQQISKLQGRGLFIDDLAKAEGHLSKIGYYRLSGYWHPMRESRIVRDASGARRVEICDTFRPGAQFSHVVDLYVFDKKLRLVMLDALERIEIALRADIALLLGKRSPWAHREAKFLHGQFSKPRAGKPSKLDDFNSRADQREQNAKDDFAAHYRRKYSDPMPIWIAVELWEFGTLSHFVSGMRVQDQDTIAARYGITRDTLRSWVWTLSFVRNICAHHGRLWNRAMVAQPMDPKGANVPLLDHLAGQRSALERFYGAAAITRYFQRQINPNSTWGARFVEIFRTFPDAPGISLKNAGFPENWRTLPIWAT